MIPVEKKPVPADPVNQMVFAFFMNDEFLHVLLGGTLVIYIVKLLSHFCGSGHQMSTLQVFIS